MSDIVDELKKLLVVEEQEAEEEKPEARAILAQHIALAAQVAGIDLTDDKALAEFLSTIKGLVTRDKSWLRAQLRRWTKGKARLAIRTTRGAIT